MARLLDDLVVVELAGAVSGAHAAKLLGDHGAAVACIEPADGAPLRADRASWTAWCTSRVTVPAGSAAAADWLAQADVVITSDAVGHAPPLPPGTADDAVWVSVSPFGAHGPRSHWRGADIVDQALGGHLYLSGRPDREPLIGPTGQAALASGVFGAIGAMAALLERERSGRGQHVEVAHVEVLAALHQFTDVRFTHSGNVLTRMGNRYAGPGSPIGMYRCADGWMAITVATGAHFETLLAVTGLERLLEEHGIGSIVELMVRGDVFDPAFEEWLATQTVAEAVDLLQTLRLAAGPVLTMRELLRDPHLAAREWWRTADVPGSAHPVTLPGPPLRIDAAGWRADPAPASPTADAADHPRPPTRAARTRFGWPIVGTRRATDADAYAGVLDGVCVLDLTRVWAGPLAARLLADLGADVVMVEGDLARGPHDLPQAYADASHFFPDDELGEHCWNRNGFINKYALGKRSVCLDLATPDGIAVFSRLVAQADVLVENYSPRVLPNWGLDEQRLHELNPSLVYLTMPGYGRSGPAKDYSAYGPVLDSHAGLSTLMGYPDTEAWKCGIAWPDPMGGIHGALGVLLALWGRARDGRLHGGVGRGATVEVAQLETAVSLVADRLVRAQLDDADPRILGNRHPMHAPQGVYRCRGADAWLAVTVADDRDWTALCDVCAPAFDRDDMRAYDLVGRRAAHDRIDAVLAECCATRDASELAQRLQDVGVAAAAVADARMLLADPHLDARGAFASVTHPEAGTQRWPVAPVRLSRTPPRLTGPAPCLGQHNTEVLAAAGLGDDEIAALVASSVLRTEPRA